MAANILKMVTTIPTTGNSVAGITFSGFSPAVTALSMSGGGTTQRDITLSRDLVEDEVGFMSYDSSLGNIVGSTGIPYPSFTNESITDNITSSFSMDKMYVYGDSLFNGFGATIPANRMTSLVAANFGATEFNNAVNGQSITPGIGSSGGSFDITTFVNKPAGNPKIFLNWQLNDSYYSTVFYGSVAAGITAYQTALTNTLASLLGKGWLVSDIVYVNDFYYETTPGGNELASDYYAYADALISFCASNSIRVVKNFPSYDQVDIVHPSDAGYLVCSNWITANLNNTVGSYDYDVQQFCAVTGITDATIKTALQTLRTSLRSGGVWGKRRVINVYVGGNSSTHAVNFKNPSRYNTTWNGGISHSSNGVTYNGSTGYGLVPINLLSDLGVTGGGPIGGSVYVGTDSTTGDDIDFGGSNAVTYFLLSSWYTFGGDNNFIARNTSASVKEKDPSASTTSKGFYSVEKVVTTVNILRNGVSVDSKTDTDAQPDSQLMTGGLYVTGSPNSFTARRHQYLSLGDGLTNAQVLAEYNAVQALQTSLSRQV